MYARRMRRALRLLFLAAISSCGPAREPAQPTPRGALATDACAPFFDCDPASSAEASLGSPISLTAPDGTSFRMVALSASVVVEDPLAFTELRLKFKNPEARQTEGRFEIILPPSAAVSRFAMRIGERMQEGEVVERERATQVYETFLHRRVDPALLEKTPGSRFQARVFPILPGEEKEIILSYSQELPRASEPYRLALRGLPRLDSFDARVLVGPSGAPARGASEALSMHERDFVPSRDIVVPLARPGERAEVGRRSGEKVVARITPAVSTAADPIESLVVLVDTSASRAFGFGAQVDWLGSLLTSIRGKAPAGATLHVAAFDQGVAAVYQGPLARFEPRDLEPLRAQRPLGASNLEKAFEHAARILSPGRGQRSRILLVSDGIASAGPLEASDLLKQAGRLAGASRLDAIALGDARDADLLRALAASALPSGGVVIDNAPSPARAAERLAAASVSGLAVSVPGARWVWPSKLNGIEPGDQVLVYADVPEGNPFEVVVGGASGQRRAVPLAPTAAAPLLDRAHAHAQIRDLSERYAAAAALPDAREEARRRIVELSTSRRVLSDFTALLVLETEGDYERFKIDRRALSEILVVGPRGLELLKRGGGSLPSERPFGPIAGGPAPIRIGSAPSLSLAPAPGQGTAPSASPSAPPSSPEDPPPDAGRGAITSSEIRIMPMVHFEGSTATIKPDSYQLLDEVAHLLKTNPMIKKIELEGHTDDRGSEAANLRISQARAEAVRSYLLKRGVHPSRVVARGYGSQKPIAANDTAENRARNRRVMFRILEFTETGPRVQPMGPPAAGPPYAGRFGELMDMLDQGRPDEALAGALALRDADPTDAAALLALGQALEKKGDVDQAARAYGSLIDLYPARADLRRAAGVWLERLAAASPAALELAIDTYRRARALRPDHPSSHRLLAFALVRAGRYEEAASILEASLERKYERFPDQPRLDRDDLGLVYAAWIKAEPGRRKAVEDRAAAAGAVVSAKPSLRFVLSWETDATNVDLDVLDAAAPGVSYARVNPPASMIPYRNIATGYGPEGFVLESPPPGARYRLRVRYSRRGAMGYAIGKVQIIEHDGRGALRIDDRPFILMNQGGGMSLGEASVAMAAQKP